MCHPDQIGTLYAEHFLQDKGLGRGAAGNTLQAVRMELGRAFGDSVSVQLFSGESKQGVDELRSVVAGWLQL